MKKNVVTELAKAVRTIVWLALVVGVIYPFAVWTLGQCLFPIKANGSLIVIRGRVVGSALIAQRFSDSRYFHPRPSAAMASGRIVVSGGSNLGPLSSSLRDQVMNRIQEYRQENGLAKGILVPADAVMTSASGLDPDISMANAILQAQRVASARGLSRERVVAMIRTVTEKRQLGFLGEERCNVLRLNLELENMR